MSESDHYLEAILYYEERISEYIMKLNTHLYNCLTIVFTNNPEFNIQENNFYKWCKSYIQYGKIIDLIYIIRHYKSTIENDIHIISYNSPELSYNSKIEGYIFSGKLFMKLNEIL